jgi:hypothetical protein
MSRFCAAASAATLATPDAVMSWCVRVCQRTARPSPKHATSNRVFVIRADKGGVLSAFCDYACTVPPRSGKGILRCPSPYVYELVRRVYQEGDLYKQTGVTPSDGLCVLEVTVALFMNIYKKCQKSNKVSSKKQTAHTIST